MVCMKNFLGNYWSYIAFTIIGVSLLAFNSQILLAQEQIGLRQSNYSGISGATLNPANASDLPIAWDLNIASAGLFAENNYAYVNQSNLIHFLKNSGSLSQNNPQDISHSQGTAATYDFYNNPNRDYFAHLNSFVSGPSFLLKVGDASVGIFANARTQFNARNIDPQLGYQDYTNIATDTPFEVKTPEIAGMSWSEIGLHLGSKLGKNIALAGNIKVLQGYDAFYFDGTGNVGLLKVEDNLQMSIDEVNYAYAGNADFDAGNYDPQINGWGLGADVGLNFYLGEVQDGPYRLKVGASLVDVGFINIDKRAQVHQINNVTVGYDNNLLTNVNNEQDLAQALSEEALLDPEASLQNTQFALWTPAAMTAQADFTLSKKLYVNAILVKGVAFNKKALMRGSSMSITPRYESRWFEVAVPMTFYGQEDLRIGTSLKLGFVTVGTDNIGSIVGKKDFTGSDVYVALKVNPWNRDKSSYNRNGKSRTKTSVDCPNNFKYGKKR